VRPREHATDVAATLASRWWESGGSGAEERGSLAKRRKDSAEAKPRQAREKREASDGRRECRSGAHARICAAFSRLLAATTSHPLVYTLHNCCHHRHAVALQKPPRFKPPAFPATTTPPLRHTSGVALRPTPCRHSQSDIPRIHSLVRETNELVSDSHSAISVSKH
jgi:hypothetical protein